MVEQENNEFNKCSHCAKCSNANQDRMKTLEAENAMLAGVLSDFIPREDIDKLKAGLKK